MVDKLRVLAVAAASASLLALLVNAIWGTDYPNTDGSDATPPVSAATYLTARPFDALALVNYSQSAGNRAATTLAERERTLTLASQLAPNDVEVIKARAALAFQGGDTLAGLNFIARWASISPIDRASAINILLSAVGSREWEKFVSEQLKADWPIADALLNAACGKLGASQLLGLGAAISRSVSIRSQTAACVSEKLISENRSADARAYWLGTLRPLPPKIGHIFNGNFAMPPGQSPFNWTLSEGGEFRDGFRVGRVNGAAPDGRSYALLVRFNGRKVNSALARQSLALPPGKYRLRYVTRQSGFVGTESARWVLRCAANAAEIEQRPETAQTLPNGWRTGGGLFTIAEACSGQSIQLELSSRLLQLTGTNASAAFADVEVERVNI